MQNRGGAPSPEQLMLADVYQADSLPDSETNRGSDRESASKPTRVLAPMLQQYVDLKQQYPEHLLLFQVGDFYEVFFEDAVRASEILQIRLTSRDKDQVEPIPMCGVPIHALDNYLPKILQAGSSCVIVSQVEEASKAKKGGVRREITRIVTPGVRYDGDGLEAHHYNYLAAVALGAGDLGAIAYVDISTGHVRVQELEGVEAAKETLDRIGPREVLLPNMLFGMPLRTDEAWLRALRSQISQEQVRLVKRPFERASRGQVHSRIKAMLPHLAEDQLSQLSPCALAVVGALIAYVEEVSFTATPRLAVFEVVDGQDTLVLDSATRINLELTATRLRGEERHSLLRHIDSTRTAMGARLLADWILSPSTDEEVLRSRHDAVDQLTQDDQMLERLRSFLLGVRDLDRLCSRITSGRAAPFDLGVLRDSLASLPALKELLAQLDAPLFAMLVERFDSLDDIHEMLKDALVEEPPLRNSEGGIFASGYNAELEDIRALRSDGTSWLAAMEQRERVATGIHSLKVKYNNVFGYSIEVSKAHSAKVPAHYERRQTLANAERYSTQELKDREGAILRAQSRLYELERELFVSLREHVAAQAERLQRVSQVLATLDVLCSFAYCARQYNYVRPQMCSDTSLEILRGRHPVVERVVGLHAFVPNDCRLDTDSRRLAVLTGPNMGGKSTYLRQVGLIQLLAQAGSFVPAESARLPIVDRIFTRIGAADDLSRGESTFMVEMRETSVILRKATKRSLVLIDEVGRGTATADGLAIATAVAEWLHDTIQCMTIFATHFHQLSDMSQTKTGAFCLSVGVLEQDDELVFTHRIEESAGDKSYGLEVAKLAGLPEALLRRAAVVLRSLDAVSLPESKVPQQALLVEPSSQVAPSSIPEPLQEVLTRLRSIKPERITPLQGLNELADLVQHVREHDA